MSEYNQSDEPEMCSAWGCEGQWAKSVSRVIPLCIRHFRDAHRDIIAYLDRVDAEFTASATPDRRSRPTIRHPEGGPVVYYVSMPPHIKIGTSTSFERRMREFYVQPRDVLAIEPGGRTLESSRHQQFASYRKRGTELFKPNGVLTELIAQLAHRYPIRGNRPGTSTILPRTPRWRPTR